MTTIAFDTLAFANKLKEAGLESKIAEVQAEETAKILNDLTISHLATKQDIQTLKMEIYSFIMKAITWNIGILGGIQLLLHFFK